MGRAVPHSQPPTGVPRGRAKCPRPEAIQQVCQNQLILVFPAYEVYLAYEVSPAYEVYPAYTLADRTPADCTLAGRTPADRTLADRGGFKARCAARGGAKGGWLATNHLLRPPLQYAGGHMYNIHMLPVHRMPADRTLADPSV